MDGMQPQEAPAQDAPQSQDVMGIVQSVGKGLASLAELLNQSQAATDQDRQMMAGVIDGFSQLVEKNLGGQEPGQDAPMPAEQGMQPMNGGPGAVPMGPNTRG